MGGYSNSKYLPTKGRFWLILFDNWH